MPQVMVARVTCPACKNEFQTPVEQVLDARADPGAKARVLNGLVNVAVCPHCRTGGALGLPFLYHDPDKELALVYMPMEAGKSDLERQQAIGRLTSAVMDSLPAEERKGYLLQPQVFLTLENLVSKMLDADGITPEMIEEQKTKADLLKRMINAPSDEVLETIIKENDGVIDRDIFRLLNMNLQLAQSAGHAPSLQRLLAVRDKLLELSTEGQQAKARGEVVEALRTEPTREKLLELLTQTPDEGTRELLIVFGRPLLDYPFFQSLTALIEAASDGDEKKRLTELRKQVLEVRDRLDEEAQALASERAALLRDLLVSSDPENLARRRFLELDQVFLNVLAANLEEAQEAGNEEIIESLEKIWALVLRLTEETLPPEMRLFNQLVSAEDEATVDTLLEKNQRLVTEGFVELLERAESQVREEGSTEAADQLKLLLEKARKIAPQSVAQEDSD